MPDITTVNDKVVEFRGVDNLVIAEVTKDSLTEDYTTGAVQMLAPVAEISKTVESSSETHYYDNVGALVIRSEGSDEVTLTVPALSLPMLAYITGKHIDDVTGAFIDGESVERYFAIGYRLKLTDGTYRYVWRLKGAFSIPDETSSTENNGTDTNNQQLTYTGLQTLSKFDNAGGTGVAGRAKSVVIDERDGKCDLTTFFSTVQTPDTIGNLAISTVTGLSIDKSTSSITVGGTDTITATTTPTGKNVIWTSSNPGVATVSGGVVTGVAAGTAVVTATAGHYSAACVVTVSTN